MSKSKALAAIFGVAAGIIIVWLIAENFRKSLKIKELKREIDENENLTKEIKERLKELIENNKEIEPQIANELSQVTALIEIKQDTTAVLKLAKIIENLLQELYKKDEEVKNIAKNEGRKKPVFADYLTHAKNKGVISSEDFHLLSVMKIIRNEEAHNLDIKKEKSRILAAFISGIGIILGLCRILRKKTIEPT